MSNAKSLIVITVDFDVDGEEKVPEATFVVDGWSVENWTEAATFVEGLFDALDDGDYDTGPEYFSLPDGRQAIHWTHPAYSVWARPATYV